MGSRLSADDAVALLASPLGAADPVALRRLRRGIRRIESAAGGNRDSGELLAALGLSDKAMLEREVTQLSIGQQQRVAAARALLGRPEIIVADEPTSSLDYDARESFLRLLMDECRAQGSSLLFVSHDTSLGGLFDRVDSLAELNRAAVAAA